MTTTKKMWTLDWTAGKIKMYDGKNYTLLTKTELLSAIAKMSPGDYLVGEYAHFGVPRVGLSMAQPFTEKELTAIYDACKEQGVILKLFPQMSTPRALNYSNLKKMEAAKDPDPDAEALWNLLRDYPEISLMSTPVDFTTDAKRQEGYDAVEVLNRMLNLVRGAGKAGYMQDVDANWQFLRDCLDDIAGKVVDGKIVKSELSPDTLSSFGLDVSGRYKKTGKINFKSSNVKLAQIYSILAILQDHDGTKKVREHTKKLPGWKFVKRYVIRMSPFHLKGGLMRSNLYWHGLRNWVGNKAKTKGLYRGGYCPKDSNVWIKQMTKAQEQEYLRYRRLYCKAIKELYCAFKRKLEG